MHVVVTGANSVVGVPVVRRLLQAGCRITATCRSELRGLSALSVGREQLRIVRFDIADARAFRLLPPRIDAVVHIAAQVNRPRNGTDDFIRSNVDGTANVVRYALSAGARSLVYTSSVSVHGRVAEAALTQESPVRDPGVYGVTKFVGERLLADVEERLPSVAIRLPGVLGPGATGAWVPTMADRMRSNTPVQVYNPDAAFNNAIHVGDLSQLVHNVLVGQPWKGFHAFPVASTHAVTIRTAVEHLKAALGSTSEITTGTASRDSFVINSDYAVANFRYAPRNTLDTLDQYAGDVLSR